MHGFNHSRGSQTGNRKGITMNRIEEKKKHEWEVLKAKIILFTGIAIVLAYVGFTMGYTSNLSLGEKLIHSLSILGAVWIIEKIFERLGVI